MKSDIVLSIIVFLTMCGFAKLIFGWFDSKEKDNG